MSQLRKRVASIIYSQLTLAISYRANKSRTSASFRYQQQRRWNEKKRKAKDDNRTQVPSVPLLRFLFDKEKEQLDSVRARSSSVIDWTNYNSMCTRMKNMKNLLAKIYLRP